MFEKYEKKVFVRKEVIWVFGVVGLIKVILYLGLLVYKIVNVISFIWVLYSLG